MILHTANDNLVILKHKRLKLNGKKASTDHVPFLSFQDLLQLFDL